jgi:hypothetical protein
VSCRWGQLEVVHQPGEVLVIGQAHRPGPLGGKTLRRPSRGSARAYEGTASRIVRRISKLIRFDRSDAGEVGEISAAESSKALRPALLA